MQARSFFLNKWSVIYLIFNDYNLISDNLKVFDSETFSYSSTVKCC